MVTVKDRDKSVGNNSAGRGVAADRAGTKCPVKNC